MADRRGRSSARCSAASTSARRPRSSAMTACVRRGDATSAQRTGLVGRRSAAGRPPAGERGRERGVRLPGVGVSRTALAGGGHRVDAAARAPPGRREQPVRPLAGRIGGDGLPGGVEHGSVVALPRVAERQQAQRAHRARPAGQHPREDVGGRRHRPTSTSSSARLRSSSEAAVTPRTIAPLPSRTTARRRSPAPARRGGCVRYCGTARRAVAIARPALGVGGVEHPGGARRRAPTTAPSSPRRSGRRARRPAGWRARWPAGAARSSAWAWRPPRCRSVSPATAKTIGTRCGRPAASAVASRATRAAANRAAPRRPSRRVVSSTIASSQRSSARSTGPRGAGRQPAHHPPHAGVARAAPARPGRPAR